MGSSFPIRAPKRSKTKPNNSESNSHETGRKATEIKSDSNQIETGNKTNLKKSNRKRTQRNKLPIVLILSCLLLLAYCVAPEKIKQLGEFPSAALRWVVLGPSWLQDGGFGSHLGSKLGGLGGILAPTWGVLGASWLQDGGFGSHLGSMLRGLGAILEPSRGSWGHHGSSIGFLGASWPQVRGSWGGFGQHVGVFLAT